MTLAILTTCVTIYDDAAIPAKDGRMRAQFSASQARSDNIVRRPRELSSTALLRACGVLTMFNLLRDFDGAKSRVIPK